MRKSSVALLMMAALLLVATAASHAQRGRGSDHAGGHGGPPRGWHGHSGSYGHSGSHGRVIVGVGPAWWGPGYPYSWPYPYPYPQPYLYPPSYGYPEPPGIVQEEPPVYLERQPPAPPEAYWYYCASARAYYPDVKRCPEEWIRVPPSPEDE